MGLHPAFTRTHFILFLLALGVCCTFANQASAQPKHSQTGEIDLKLEGEKKEDPYTIATNGIINKLDAFQADIESMPLTTPPTFTEDELTLLAALHLYCSLQQGVCTIVPFTLFEMDLVRGNLEGKATCPNLVRFWKQFVAMDGERRIQLSLKVVHYEKRTKYTSTLRPKLLRCSETANGMLEKVDDSSSFFAERYKEDGDKRKLPKKLKSYLIGIHKKIPNLWRELRVRG